MEKVGTRETIKFHFDAWLSRQRDDGQLMRELPAKRPQRDTLPGMIHHLLPLLIAAVFRLGTDLIALLILCLLLLLLFFFFLLGRFLKKPAALSFQIGSG